MRKTFIQLSMFINLLLILSSISNPVFATEVHENLKTVEYVNKGVEHGANTLVAFGVEDVIDSPGLPPGALKHLNDHIHSMEKISKGAKNVSKYLKIVQVGLIAYDTYKTYGEKGYAEAFNTALRGALTTAAGWGGAASRPGRSPRRR